MWYLNKHEIKLNRIRCDKGISANIDQIIALALTMPFSQWVMDRKIYDFFHRDEERAKTNISKEALII